VAALEVLVDGADIAWEGHLMTEVLRTLAGAASLASAAAAHDASDLDLAARTYVLEVVHHVPEAVGHHALEAVVHHAPEAVAYHALEVVAYHALEVAAPGVHAVAEAYRSLVVPVGEMAVG
jgi:hypothetical protein